MLKEEGSEVDHLLNFLEVIGKGDTGELLGVELGTLDELFGLSSLGKDLLNSTEHVRLYIIKHSRGRIRIILRLILRYLY